MVLSKLEENIVYISDSDDGWVYDDAKANEVRMINNSCRNDSLTSMLAKLKSSFVLMY